MTSNTEPRFLDEEDPANPGWRIWELTDQTRFNTQIMGRTLIRRDPDGKARTRIFPEHRHTNLAEGVHGGIILSLIDISLFSGARIYGVLNAGAAVTLDLNTQFIAAARAHAPLDSVVEVLRETRRLIFLRGIVEQEGELIAAFSGTIRKSSAPVAS